MYLGNPNIRAAGEEYAYSKEEINELVRCSQDIIYFAMNYFHIVTIDHGKVKIPLYEYQKKVLKLLIEPPDTRQNAYIVVPRQMGKTVLMTIYILHYALFNEYKNVYLVANKLDAAQEIMYRIQLAFKDLPIFMQSGVKEMAKTKIEFENGTRITAATTTGESVTGQSISLLYIDEFAKIPENMMTDFMNSCMPTLSSGKTSKVVITTTPKGMGLAYDYWYKAERNMNSFYPIRIGYWEHPDRDQAWKKRQIADIGLTAFRQEYLCQWLGSVDTLIDADILTLMKPQTELELKYGSSFKIFERPVIGADYIIGVDIGNGIGRDSSVVQVFRMIDKRCVIQVGVYANNRVSVENFAQVVLAIAEYYNDCRMMIENNFGGDQLCKIITYEYDNENIVSYDPVRLGVNANKHSKYIGVMTLKRYLEEGWMTLVDQNTIDQLANFTEVQPNVFKAATDKKGDDLVMASVWVAYYMYTRYSEDFDDDFEDEVIKAIDPSFRINGNKMREEQKNKDDEMPMAFFS